MTKYKITNTNRHKDKKLKRDFSLKLFFLQFEGFVHHLDAVKLSPEERCVVHLAKSDPDARIYIIFIPFCTTLIFLYSFLTHAVSTHLPYWRGIENMKLATVPKTSEYYWRCGIRTKKEKFLNQYSIHKNFNQFPLS